MKKFIAIAFTALLLTGCSAVRVADTAEVVPIAEETRVELVSNTEFYGTTYEFERDLYTCEQLHPVPADHSIDHPESTPLAECVLATYKAHGNE